MMKKREPSLSSLGSDGNTSFLRAARAGHLDKVLEHLKTNIDINTSNANGLNALHLASKDGHVDVVAELLKRGAVVDAATKKGNTALHIASLAGQEEVVKLLVQHGASVNVQSQNGFTPLYMAAQENHDNVVKYLLANGANQSLATEDGFTPLAVAMQQGHDKVVTVLLENDTRGKVRLPALHIAAKKDDVKAAKLLLENEHNPDVTSKSGFTPLHIASHYGNESIANLLIAKGADVNYAAKHNITPLHVAAKWGKTNMVALLLEKGANIESKTRDGLTPLHCAARSGHEQVVDMLLERGAPISCKTKNGLAPLHMAAQGDHVDAARILLYHRAPVDEVTVDYLTALHVAAHCGHVRVAKLLLDRQADANARALNGFTPLHIACKKNRIKVVELLLKHGASIGATTESGLTPLHVASFMGCMNIVIYLLQHDANPDVPTVRGETPLHLAARANQNDIIRILLRNGAQVDARAREQQTALHIASRLGNVDIVMLLLQHGAKVDTTTKDMYTALHIAAKEGQDEVAAVLLENGASLNATTKKGFTPLHLAAKYGNMKVAKLLLQKEAAVDAQGKNGVTPLHVASHYDHQNVALLLLDKGASPHATAKNGHTPLHIAAKKNQMDIANTLLEYGAKPNAESKAGFTPLHLSAQEGHTDMSSLLIEHEASTNHPAKNGLTPLHLCAQEDRVPVAEILVKNGAEIDSATKGGFTPLHIASHYGQTNMVKFLLANGGSVLSTTSLGYTPLHQAAQQGHTNIVNILLENEAQPNAVTNSGQTPLHIAQKLGYISVIETLKIVTETTTTTTTTTTVEEKYKVVAPEAMQETFMSDSEEEGGEDTVLGDHSYRYLTADEMKSLGDDSLPIDVTRDERIDSNKMVTSETDQNALPPQAIEDGISPQYITENYVEYTKKYIVDNVDIARHPINIGKLHWKNFLVSFLVDARGGAMRGCRHSGVRVIVPPRCAPSPTRITCRYVRPQRTPHPPPLMEGEALASRVLELGPVGAKFLGPVIIEVPHFAALRGKEREIVILRSDNGETWREHTVDSSEDILNEVLNESFEAEDLNQLEDVSSGRITRIVTPDFPQYFAIVTRIRQEVHAIGPEGGMVSSTVVPQVQAVFPQGALTKKIKVGLQAQPIDPELAAKLLGHGVAVSPVVTVEPRRRKFHKAITLSMPAPRAHSQGMINQYSGNAPTLRLLCSITGGTTRAQWEDVTGSTPLTFVNDCVSFTTTVSARFWLMDCRNISDATKMATELYREAIHVPFMAKFVVFAKRIDPLEARLRVFCMTDDKEDKTLEHQEHFTEVAKSRDVEVLEGKPQYIEFAGNLVPITKSGEPLQFSFRAFRENRLPFSVRVKDQHAEAIGRCLFMREPKVAKGEPPQQPICILNIVLPDDIVTETTTLTDVDTIRRHAFLKDNFEYYRPDPRLADMSNLLGEDWVPLATQLGLTPSEINVIKSEYPDSVAKQAQSMLRMWISQSGNKAQGDTLENALKRIGREDIIPQCLNVDDVDRIPRIERYQKKDIESVLETSPKRFETYESKYSAEEKAVEEQPSDEEDFNKTVSERRDQIQKRLTENIIPASQQRQEIVEEITTIKRQSMVEDKIAEVEVKQKTEPTKTVTTQGTETKTVVESIEKIKATEPSDYQPTEVTITKQFMEDDKPDRKTTVRTIITETRTTEHIPSNEITDRRDSELLESVTQRLETKKATPRISTTEVDPNSPKLSKTPPPSPADFIYKEQAAAMQEWRGADRQSKEKPAVLIEKDAVQGLQATPTAKYLASSEELSIESPKIDKQFTNDSDTLRQINAYNDTDQKPKARSRDSSREDTSRGDEKKSKKGFFGTLRSMVSKSQDRSDSESEKSQKKDKRKKKDKKKRKPPMDPPERPPRKPKLPTPPPLHVEDRPEFRDIPFVEYSPQDTDNGLPPAVPVTDLDISDEIKAVAKHIVTDVITTGETTAMDIIQNGEASPGKQVTTIQEEITKKIEPKIYERGEFHIVVSPISPPKTRDYFKTQIEESILDNTKTPVRPMRRKEHIYEDIEEPQDIKSLTTNLIQNEIHFFGWADDHYNICKSHDVKEKTQSLKKEKKQGKLFGFLGKKSSKDVEDSDTEKEIIEKQDREPSKERIIKPDASDDESADKKSGFFGIFGKKTKKEDNDEKIETNKDDSKKEDVKADASPEISNTLPATLGLSEKVTDTKVAFAGEEPKDKRKVKKEKVHSESEDESEGRKGLFGIFAKKGKKDIKEEIQIAEPKMLSEATLKDMTNTAVFLKHEIELFEDVKPVSVHISPKETSAVTKNTKLIQQKAEQLPKKSKKKQDKRESSISDDEPEATKKSSIFNIFGKRKREKSREKSPKASAESKISEEVVRQIIETNNFLHNEVQAYDDVKPSYYVKIVPQRDEPDVTIISTTKTTVEEYTPNKEKMEKTIKEIEVLERVETIERKVVTEPVITKEIITSEDIQKRAAITKEDIVKIDPQKATDTVSKVFKEVKPHPEVPKETIIPKAKEINKDVLMDMISSSNFLKDEIEHFHDVKPIFREEIVEKQSVESHRKIKAKPEKSEVPNKGGFLDMFRKKQDKGKEHSDEFKQALKKCDNFLQGEITRYEDVRPIILPKKQDVMEETATQSTVHMISEVATNQFQETLSATNNFLIGEINHFEDVRPVWKKSLAAQREKKSPEKKLKKIKRDSSGSGDESESKPLGLFKIFGKKDKKYKEKHPIAEKSELKTEEKPIYSKEFEQTLMKTNAFLTDEISRYGDIKQTVERQDNSSNTKMTYEKPVNEEQLSLTKKYYVKQQKSEDVDYQCPIKYSDDFKLILHDTKKFLFDEVAQFDDVKEMKPMKAANEKTQRKDKKEYKKIKKEGGESGDESDSGKSGGFFKMFGRRERKEKPEKPITETKEIEASIDQFSNLRITELKTSKEKITYTEEFIQVLTDTNKFLENEVQNFNDVKSLLKPESHTETCEPSSERKLKKEFKKGKRESSESEDESDSAKAGLLKFFGKKDKKVKEEADTQHKIAEVEEVKLALTTPIKLEFQKMRTDTCRFLNDEITHFEDVKLFTEKPVIPKTGTKSEVIPSKKQNKDKKHRRSKRDSSESGEDSDTGKSSGFFKLFVKKDKKEVDNRFPEDTKGEEIEKEVNQEQKSSKKKSKKHKNEDEPSKSFFDIFGKKGKQDKDDIKLTTSELSPEVIKDMQDTQHFLMQEVDNFDDVKSLPVIKSDIALDGKMTIAEITKSMAPKVYEMEDFKVVISPVAETKSKEFSLDLKEPIEKMEREISSTKQSELPLTDDVQVLSMKPLEEHYEEVVIPPRPVTLQKVDNTTQPETQVTKFSDKTPAPPPFSEEVIKNMINTSNFLNQEITRFEDVRPIINREDCELGLTDKKKRKEKRQKSIEDGSKKMGFFGLFAKKEKKEEKDMNTQTHKVIISTEQLPAAELTLEDKENIFKTSLEFPETVHFTNNFLNNEIKNYDDVKPNVKELVGTKDIEAIASKEQDERKEEINKGKSIFSLFSKKSEERTELDHEKSAMKEKRERRKSGSPFRIFSKKTKEEEKSDSKTQGKLKISEATVRDIYETKNFLSTEILRYDDVKVKPEKSEKDLKKVAFAEHCTTSIQEEEQPERVIVIIREDVQITKLGDSKDNECKASNGSTDLSKPAVTSKERQVQLQSDLKYTTDNIDKIEGNIPSSAGDKSSTISDADNNFPSKLIKGFEDLEETICSSSQQLNETGTQIIKDKDKSTEQVSEMATALQSDTKKITKKPGSFFAKLGEKITGKSKDVNDALEETKEEVIDLLTDSKKLTKKEVKETTGPLNVEISEKVEDVHARVDERVENINQDLAQQKVITEVTFQAAIADIEKDMDEARQEFGSNKINSSLIKMNENIAKELKGIEEKLKKEVPEETSAVPALTLQRDITIRADDDDTDRVEQLLCVHLDQVDKSKIKDKKKTMDKQKSGTFFSKLSDKISGKSKETKDETKEATTEHHKTMEEALKGVEEKSHFDGKAKTKIDELEIKPSEKRTSTVEKNLAKTEEQEISNVAKIIHKVEETKLDISAPKLDVQSDEEEISSVIDKDIFAAFPVVTSLKSDGKQQISDFLAQEKSSALPSTQLPTISQETKAEHYETTPISIKRKDKKQKERKKSGGFLTGLGTKIFGAGKDKPKQIQQEEFVAPGRQLPTANILGMAIDTSRAAMEQEDSIMAELKEGLEKEKREIDENITYLEEVTENKINTSKSAGSIAITQMKEENKKIANEVDEKIFNLEKQLSELSDNFKESAVKDTKAIKHVGQNEAEATYRLVEDETEKINIKIDSVVSDLNEKAFQATENVKTTAISQSDILDDKTKQIINIGEGTLDITKCDNNLTKKAVDTALESTKVVDSFITGQNIEQLIEATSKLIEKNIIDNKHAPTQKTNEIGEALQKLKDGGNVTGKITEEIGSVISSTSHSLNEEVREIEQDAKSKPKERTDSCFIGLDQKDFGTGSTVKDTIHSFMALEDVDVIVEKIPDKNETQIITEDASSYFSQAGERFQAASDHVNENIDKKACALSHVMKSIPQTINEGKEDVFEKLDKISQTTEESTAHIRQTINDGTEQTAEETGSIFSTFEKSLKGGRKLKDDATDISKVSVVTEDETKILSQNLKYTTESQTGTAQDTAVELTNKIVDTSKGTGETASKFFVDLGGDIRDKGEQLKEKTRSATSNIAVTISNATNSIVQTISNAEQAALSIATSKTDDIKESGNIEKNGEKAKKTASEVVSFIPNLGKKLVGSDEKLEDDTNAKTSEDIVKVDTISKSVWESQQMIKTLIGEEENVHLKDQIKNTIDSTDKSKISVTDIIEQTSEVGTDYMAGIEIKLSDSAGHLKSSAVVGIANAGGTLKESKHFTEKSALNTAIVSEEVINGTNPVNIDIATSVSDAINDGKSATQNVKETQRTTLHIVKDDTAGIVDQTKEKSKEAAQGAVSFVSYVEEKVVYPSAASNEDLNTTSTETGTIAKDAITETQDLAAASEEVKGKIIKATDKTKSKAKKVAKEAGSFFSNLGSKILGSGAIPKEDAINKPTDKRAAKKEQKDALSSKGYTKEVAVKPADDSIESVCKVAPITSTFFVDLDEKFSEQGEELKEDSTIKICEAKQTIDDSAVIVAKETKQCEQAIDNSIGIKELVQVKFDDSEGRAKETIEGLDFYPIEQSRDLMDENINTKFIQIEKTIDYTSIPMTESVKDKIDDTKDGHKKTAEVLDKEVEQMKSKDKGDARAVQMCIILSGSDIPIPSAQCTKDTTQSVTEKCKVISSSINDDIAIAGKSVDKLTDTTEKRTKKSAEKAGSFFPNLNVSTLRTEEKTTIDTILKGEEKEIILDKVKQTEHKPTDKSEEMTEKYHKEERSLFSKADSSFSNLEGKLSVTGVKTKDEITDKAFKISTLADKSTTAAVDTAETAQKTVTDKSKDAKEVVKSKVDNAEITTKKIIDRAKETIEKTAEEAKSKFEGEPFGIDQVEKGVNLKINETAKSLSDTTKEVIIKAHKLEEDAESKVDVMKQSIIETTESTKDAPKEATKAIASLVSIDNIAKYVQSDIKRTKEDTLDKISDIEQAIEENLNDTKETISKATAIISKSDIDGRSQDIIIFNESTKDVKGAIKTVNTLFIEAEQGASSEGTEPKKLTKEVTETQKSLEPEPKSEIESTGEKCDTDKSGGFLSGIGEKLFGKPKDMKGKGSKKTSEIKHEKYPLITSPTLPRRAESQRIVRGDVPYCVEVTTDSHDLSSDDESYIVIEPPDSSARISEPRKRKPLFHIESEEDSTEISSGHRGSIHSNVLDSLSEQKFDALVTDLDDYEDVVPIGTTFTSNALYDVSKSSQQPTDTDIIEQKLNDIEKALGSLEQQEAFKEGVSETKLRRVERKFERMASAAIEKDQSEGKASKLTTPEVDEKRETDFRHLVSQLSTEEVSDFQKEYATLWDEQTFSHSDEWDTLKTPDSQAEELPQGEALESTEERIVPQQTVTTSTTTATTVTRVETEEPAQRGARQQSQQDRPIQDQHMLSDEMKRLLQELEEESKK